jgi:hypothetical protein
LHLLFRERYGENEELVLSGDLRVSLLGVGEPFSAWDWMDPAGGFTSSPVSSVATVDGVLEIRTQNSVYRLRRDRRRQPEFPLDSTLILE